VETLRKADALRTPSGESVEVRFRRRPFILRPERKGEESWRGVLERLWASRGRGANYVDEHFFPQLSAAGEKLGISWDFEGDVGNSMDSLRLVFWVGELEQSSQVPIGTQENLCKMLGSGHFEERRCVGNRNVLVETSSRLFEELGDEYSALRQEAVDLLNSDRMLQQVWASIEREHEEGHYSIPVALLSGRLLVAFLSFVTQGSLPFTALLTDGSRVLQKVNGAASQDEYEAALISALEAF
jgi:predicted DsbA family dithiol-disulfide isomerase